MGWITRDLRCEKCEYIWDDLVEIQFRDELAACPRCQEISGMRTISKPNYTKASYVDGTRRFRDHREANKLTIEKSSANKTTRKQISDEIRKIGIKQYD